MAVNVASAVQGMTTTTVGGRNFYMVSKPPFLTRAVIIVAGAEYYEWTSVSVRLQVGGNPAASFTFTCSEQEPLGNFMAALRIRPPDPCLILLDGWLVIDGFVTTRQVYYDAKQHSVQIQGMSQAGKAGTVPAILKTGEIKGADIAGLWRAIGSPAGLNITAEGVLPSTKFERAAIQPGETVFEMGERFMRAVGVINVPAPNGRDVVLTALGVPSGLGGAYVIEGLNIVTGRETIHTMQQAGGHNFAGQGAGGDSVNYAEANQRRGESKSPDQTKSIQPGTVARSLMEVPAFSQALAKTRAVHEASISDQNMISVTISVNGWQKPGGGLWWPHDFVWVDSPMLIMKRDLIIKAVTFTQDSSGGTQTALDLVNPPNLGQGRTPFTGGLPAGVPQNI
jgi:prophage tail gpP-like protein